jgi:hypothetical protein
VSNAVGSVGSSYATLTVVPPPALDWLVNVDFRSGPVEGMSTKAGPAAVGLGTNDFWNYYTRDDASGNWLSFGALADLLRADGNPTTVGMTVANAPGAWFNASEDEMYQRYIYPFSGSATVTITNLPPGAYDVYVYSYDGNYELLVDGITEGVQTCYESPIVNPPVWQQGIHYALFQQVDVAAGEHVEVIIRDGLGGYAIISGLQIASSFAGPALQEHSGLMLSALTPDPAQGIRLIFGGSAEDAYLIETSEDLVHWEPVGTATYTGGGQFQFADPEPMDRPCRFYRAVPASPATE